MMDDIIKQLDQIYGPGRGFSVCNTIMPGILADFNKMLKNAPVDREISEEYCLEDMKASILVKGKRKSNGDPSLAISLCLGNNKQTE